MGLALVAGSGMGILVAVDAPLSHAPLVSYLFGTALRDYPLVTAGAGTILGLGATACLVWHDRIWQWCMPLAIALLMLSLHFLGFSKGPLNPSVFAILLVVGVWLLEFLGRDAALPRSAFRTLAILFFVSALLSTLGKHPSEVLVGLASFLPKFLIAIVVAELLDDRNKVSFAVSAMLWSAGLLAVVALAQVGAYVLFQVVYSIAEPDFRFVNTPFGPLLRASGFSRTANQFVLPVGVVCVISAYLAVALTGWKRRVLFMTLALVTAAAVALSFVRGMWIAMVAGLLALPFIAKPRLTPLWFALAFVVSLTAVTSGFADWVIQSLVSLAGSSIVERFDLNAAGLQAMLSSPFGAGISNFGSASPTFERYPVHNAVIQVGSELGLPGFVLFIVLLVWTSWRLLRAMLAATDAEARARIGALLAGYVVLVIAIQVEPEGYSLFLWIYLGLAEAATRTIAKT